MAGVDPRDVALQASCPVVAMPKFSQLPEMCSGQRLILARNGVFVHFANPWLQCTVLAGELDTCLSLPFGEHQESVSFSFGVLPLTMLQQFVEEGRRALPNEAAGALVFDCDSQRLSLRMHESIDRSMAHIRYRIDPLGPNELLAVDLHTHGRLPAFWSRQDDLDDMGVRVCGVFGNLDREEPTAQFRLVVNGLRRDLPCPWRAGEGGR